ncbi:MAG: hypothetical protein ACEY29_03095 [Arsenophonus sp.]
MTQNELDWSFVFYISYNFFLVWHLILLKRIQFNCSGSRSSLWF